MRGANGMARMPQGSTAASTRERTAYVEGTDLKGVKYAEVNRPIIKSGN